MEWFSVVVARLVSIGLSQLEVTCGRASGLPQAQAEHALQGQTKLERRIAENRRSASTPAERSLSLKPGIKPDLRK